MRDFLSTVLILCGLAAGGYAVWVAVQRRRGAPTREGVPRARTIAVVSIIVLLLGGAAAPAEQHSAKKTAAPARAHKAPRPIAKAARAAAEPAAEQVFAQAQE